MERIRLLNWALAKVIKEAREAKGLDVPELSVAAIREALINAFCHRDYHGPHEVQVAIFKDRVELRNPGKLFGGLTIDQLREGNVSARRNPLIADMLRRIQMIEGWGRGLRLILDNEPKAQFQEIAHIFMASFPRPSFEPDYAVKAAEANGVRQSAENTETGTKTGTKTSQKPLNNLSKQESGILYITEKTPTISIQEIAAKTGLSKNGVRYHIENLKKRGLLRRIGGAKGGHWEIMPG